MNMAMVSGREHQHVKERSGNDESGFSWIQPTLSERDRTTLRRLGKRPVLKRNFGFISILGFSCTILIAWETVLTTLNFGLANGGPAGLIYQYIFVWIGVALSFVTITEMVSMAPTSGGQYHWVSILAPASTHNFLSYVTGWLTVCGWQANTASGAFLSAALIEGMASVANPNYTPQAWHLVLISWAVVAFAAFMNVRGGTALPRFEAVMLLLHIFGFFAVIIPLLTLAPKQNASFVFRDWENQGLFPTQGLSFMVGILGMLWTFSGADGAIHMSEEVENAALVVPRSILTTYILNGVLGLAMLIAVLFCTQDVDAALASSTGYPFMAIFQASTGSRGGAVVMIAIPAVMEIVATTSSFASASRQFWSFSRDRGVPGWKLFSQVEKTSSIPIHAVMLTAIVSVLLQLINFGSSTVFQDLVSLAIAGLYSSYLVATSLLLYRRLTGGIHFLHDTNEALSNTMGASLTWGPWHVPGIAGTLLNVFVCCFLAVAWFFSFWPMSMDVDASTINYNCVLWGAVVIFALIYYVVQGRKQYSGPVIEADDISDSSRERLVQERKHT